MSEYLEEIYDEDDEDREQTPLSQFARDQGETWYDHDFMAHGFKKNAKSVEDLVNGYSYFEQWSAELARRAAEAGLTKINMLLFMSQDQIDKPRSVEGEGYKLHYMGTIKYRI
ncbi:MAG: immunity 22 family protein [Planctomycetaceae bacterium]|nr:immunity 22 family protein [Planctomycetaceae bacterium]